MGWGVGGSNLVAAAARGDDDGAGSDGEGGWERERKRE